MMLGLLLSVPSRVTAQPAGAEGAVEYQLERGTVVAVSSTERTALDLGGEILALHHAADRLYVARGPAGANVYDLSDPLAPRLLETIPAPGGSSIVGFNVIGEQVWAELVSRAMIPLAPLGSVAASVGSGSSVPAPPRVPETTPQPLEAAPLESGASETEVVSLRKLDPGTIELAVGADAGVRVGDRFAIFRTTQMTSGEVTGFVGEELVAFAEVTAVKADRSLAEVSRTAWVRDTDFARRARPEQNESSTYPPRVPGVGEAFATLRPIVNTGAPLGFGVLADLGVTYWGGAYQVGVRVQPLGLGWTEDGDVVSSAALFEGGYDGRAFAVGLGVGASWVNGDIDTLLKSYSASYDESSGGTSREERQETHVAFTLSQWARLGSRDGLNLTINNLLLLHRDPDEDRRGFIYGGTAGKLTIPVDRLDRGSDLFLEGGGGVMGYWYFGAGVATWIVGNGSPGSWRMSISAGGAGIWGTREVTQTTPTSTWTYDENIEIAGPMVAVGLTRRFAL